MPEDQKADTFHTGMQKLPASISHIRCLGISIPRVGCPVIVGIILVAVATITVAVAAIAVTQRIYQSFPISFAGSHVKCNCSTIQLFAGEILFADLDCSHRSIAKCRVGFGITGADPRKVDTSGGQYDGIMLTHAALASNSFGDRYPHQE